MCVRVYSRVCTLNDANWNKYKEDEKETRKILQALQVTHTVHNNNKNKQMKAATTNYIGSQLLLLRLLLLLSHLAQQSNCILGWLIYLLLFRTKSASVNFGHRSMRQQEQKQPKFPPICSYIKTHTHTHAHSNHLYMYECIGFSKNWNLNLNDCCFYFGCARLLFSVFEIVWNSCRRCALV